jgi:hypothetical protein
VHASFDLFGFVFGVDVLPGWVSAKEWTLWTWTTVYVTTGQDRTNGYWLMDCTEYLDNTLLHRNLKRDSQTSRRLCILAVTIIGALF